ncbi:hypothetical protein ACFE04_005573 [Oxalis oulophora]
MASSMLSTATVASINGSPAQATMVAPFSGLRSTSSFPVTKKTTDITSVATNGGRVQCMQVWPPLGLKKFETLSYLPQLTREQLAKEVDYLLKNKWIPCLEFDCGSGFISRDYHSSPGYYDGRYWTMWKLPMYGCTDPAQVLNEVDEAVKAYPDSFVRIIGFDNNRQAASSSSTLRIGRSKRVVELEETVPDDFDQSTPYNDSDTWHRLGAKINGLFLSTKAFSSAAFRFIHQQVRSSSLSRVPWSSCLLSRRRGGHQDLELPSVQCMGKANRKELLPHHALGHTPTLRNILEHSQICMRWQLLPILHPRYWTGGSSLSK